MASKLAQINYEVRRGDSSTFTHRVTVGSDFSNSLPFDLTDYEIVGQVKYDIDLPNSWIDLPIVIIDPLDGRWQFSFTASETTDLLPIGSPNSPTARYDIQIRKTNEPETTTQTIQAGSFTVLEDITRDPTVTDSGEAPYTFNSAGWAKQPSFPLNDGEHIETIRSQPISYRVSTGEALGD